MADWAGIKAAIATRCATVSGIKHASSTNIDSAPVTPAVIVTHVGDMEVIRGIGFEERNAEVAGVLLVSTSEGTGSAMSRSDGLLENLFVEFRNGTLLGYPTVVQDAWLSGATADVIEVGTIKYEGYRLRWQVHTREGVTRTADRV